MRTDYTSLSVIQIRPTGIKELVFVLLCGVCCMHPAFQDSVHRRLILFLRIPAVCTLFFRIAYTKMCPRQVTTKLYAPYFLGQRTPGVAFILVFQKVRVLTSGIFTLIMRPYSRPVGTFAVIYAAKIGIFYHSAKFLDRKVSYILYSL